MGGGRPPLPCYRLLLPPAAAGSQLWRLASARGACRGLHPCQFLVPMWAGYCWYSTGKSAALRARNGTASMAHKSPQAYAIHQSKGTSCKSGNRA